MAAKGEEIFAKDALNIKQMKKMDKTEIDSTIEINLQNLVDYYYTSIYHKEERPFRTKLIDLVLSKKYFIKPIMRIYKDNPEIIPEGLPLMMVDCVEQSRRIINEKIEAEKASNKPKEEIESTVKALEDYFITTSNEVMDVLKDICEKNIKRLKKLGMKKEYAVLFAPHILSAEYVTSKNMFRFVNDLTKAIYKLVAVSQKEVDGENVTVLGIDLTNKKVLAKFLELNTKSMDLGTYGEFIKQILLEKRDKNIDQLSQAQLAVYSAITNYALRVLDDKDIFNNKSRQEILKSYGIQLQRDEKRGRNAKRRVVFSELDSDMFPRITKALDKITSKENDD